MNDYSYLFIEKYGHGKLPSNDIPDDQKVTLCDHDDNYYVYECDSNELAERIARWFAVCEDKESNCYFFNLIKNHNRYFHVEIREDQYLVLPSDQALSKREAIAASLRYWGKKELIAAQDCGEYAGIEYQTDHGNVDTLDFSEIVEV